MKTLTAAVTSPENKSLASDGCNEDEDGAFGRYVGSELKGISDQKTKLILKHTISNAIFNAKMNLLQGPQHSSQLVQPVIHQPPQHQLPGVAYSSAPEHLNPWRQQQNFTSGNDNENNYDPSYSNSSGNFAMSYMQLLG
jgi:hypothetical protein